MSATNPLGRRLGTGTIALVLALAACGGGDDAASSTESPAPPATDPPATDPPPTDPPPTDPPATDPPATEPPVTDATAGETATLPDVATVARGAGLLSFSDQFDDSTWAAMNLIDGRSDRGWSSATPTGSFVIGVAHGPVQAIAIDTREAQEAQYPGISAASVQIEAVVDLAAYPDLEWEPLGTLEMQPNSLDVLPTPGLRPQQVLFRFTVENGGHPDYVEIMEVVILSEMTETNPTLAAFTLTGEVDFTLGDEVFHLATTPDGVLGCSDSATTLELQPVDGALHGTIAGADGSVLPVQLTILITQLSLIADPDGEAITAQAEVGPGRPDVCTLPGGSGDDGDDSDVEAAEPTPVDQREVDPPLVIAAARGELDEVNAQLAAGADPNIAREQDGWTPLIFAAQDGYTDVVTTLIDAGAAVDRGTDDGWTALMIASQNGHEDTVAELLAAGANPRVGRSDNWTALHSAALRNRVGVVTQLISAGAPLNPAESGFTPLTIAAQEGNDAVITQLLDAGARVSGSPSAGPTPLFMATQNNHITAAELLLAADADPDDGGTEPPPMVAAGARSRTEFVSLLAAAGADLDAQRGDGLTALHWAAYNDDAALAELLLGLGADPSIVDDDDRTPLDLAEGRDSAAAAAVLRGG